MTNQTTNEAVVDIVERLRFSHSQGLFEAVDKGMHVPYEEAADEIETLRAQLTAATTESRRFKALADDHFRNAQQVAERLTAATRRAEQAERMLAEVWQPIETIKHEHGVPIIVCQDGIPSAVVEWLDAEFVDEPGFISGWYISDGKNDPIWYRGNPYLTHWQPLFPPPSIRSAASGEQG